MSTGCSSPIQKRVLKFGSDEELPASIEEWYEKMMIKLYDQPRILKTTFMGGGKKAWQAFRGQHFAEQRDEDFPTVLEGVWSKYEGLTARIALILQNVRFVCKDTSTRNVEEESIVGAAKVIAYYKEHYKKVFEHITSTPEDKLAIHVLEWIRKYVKKEDTHDYVTAAVLCKGGVGGIRQGRVATNMLYDLKDRGFGRLIKGQRGGLGFIPNEEKAEQEK